MLSLWIKEQWLQATKWVHRIKRYHCAKIIGSTFWRPTWYHSGHSGTKINFNCECSLKPPPFVLFLNCFDRISICNKIQNVELKYFNISNILKTKINQKFAAKQLAGYIIRGGLILWTKIIFQWTSSTRYNKGKILFCSSKSLSLKKLGIHLACWAFWCQASECTHKKYLCTCINFVGLWKFKNRERRKEISLE